MQFDTYGQLYKQWFIDDSTETKWLSKKELEECGSNNYFQWTFLFDSARTYYWKDHYWFEAICKTTEDVYYSELFSFDKENGKIVKITSSQFKNFGYPNLRNIHFFSDEMFYMGFSTTDDPTGNERFIVIDSENLKVKKDIFFLKSSRINKVYTNGKELYVEIQPYRRELNLSYYLTFFLHCPEPKWEYFPYGNVQVFIFNNELNLINRFGEY